MMFSTSCRGFACWASKELARLMPLLSLFVWRASPVSFFCAYSLFHYLHWARAWPLPQGGIIVNRFQVRHKERTAGRELMNYDADVIVVGAGCCRLGCGK